MRSPSDPGCRTARTKQIYLERRKSINREHQIFEHPSIGEFVREENNPQIRRPNKLEFKNPSFSSIQPKSSPAYNDYTSPTSEKSSNNSRINSPLMQNSHTVRYLKTLPYTRPCQIQNSNILQNSHLDNNNIKNNNLQTSSSHQDIKSQAQFYRYHQTSRNSTSNNSGYFVENIEKKNLYVQNSLVLSRTSSNSSIINNLQLPPPPTYSDLQQQFNNCQIGNMFISDDKNGIVDDEDTKSY